MSKKDYNKDQIRVLSDIEAIQMRPGMYVGSTETPNILYNEVLDNAVDEITNGYATHADVIINYDENSYSIRDYGRGIPHGKKIVDDKEQEVVQTLIFKSHSGGKFDNNAYLASSRIAWCTVLL